MSTITKLLIQGSASQGEEETVPFYEHEVDQSLRFNDDDSSYLSYTPAVEGDTKTWTFSTWVKRGNLGVADADLLFTAGVGAQSTDRVALGFISSNALWFRCSLSGDFTLQTSQVFRDTASWYHIVAVLDTTQATASDRMKLYVNGVKVTDFSVETYPSIQNSNFAASSTVPHAIGVSSYSNPSSYSDGFLDGYLAETHFIDGQSLEPTSFGKNKEGVWIPMPYTGTYGTNGFYLPYKQDYSVEGFSSTLYQGTGADHYVGGTGFQGDLVWIKSRTGTANSHKIFDSVRGAGLQLASDSTSAEAVGNHDSFENDGFTVPAAGSSNYAGTDYVAWSWDAGDGSVNANKQSAEFNGTSTYLSRTPTTPTDTTKWTASFWLYQPENPVEAKHLFTHYTSGSKNEYIYTSVDGKIYYQLDNGTAYLSGSSVTPLLNMTGWVHIVMAIDTAQVTPADRVKYYFNGVQDTATGGTFPAQGMSTYINASGNVNNIGRRSDSQFYFEGYIADFHFVDGQALTPTSFATAGNPIEYTGSYGTNGFYLDFQNGTQDASGNGNDWTNNGATITGVHPLNSSVNTAGTIDSIVKANVAQGFSIVSWTGSGSGSTSVGHGLSQTPDLWILKNRDISESWGVGSTAFGGANDYMYLDSTQAKASNSTIWSAAPTSSVVNVGSIFNASNKYIMYCWHSVAGYSKIGSYTGDGGTLTNSIDLGFRPAFLLVKGSGQTSDWGMYDLTREGDSTIDNYLRANTADAETQADGIRVTDTGFTWADTTFNTLNNTYIYMAFADTREFGYWLDDSGNNNDFESHALTESDVSEDSPTQNFATWNNLIHRETSSISQVWGEGNLKVTTADTLNAYADATMAMSSGKYYWEIQQLSTSGSAPVRSYIGIKDITDTSGTQEQILVAGDALGYYNNGIWETDQTTTWTNGDIMGVTFDVESHQFELFKNNVSVVSFTVQPYKTTWTPVVSDGRGDGTGSDTITFIANFGQDSSFNGRLVSQGYTDANGRGDFYYQPPTGALALCTRNLPEPVTTPNGNQTLSDYYEIANSVKLNGSVVDAEAASFSRTLPSSGSTTTWTMSFWTKVSDTGGQQNFFNGRDGFGVGDNTQCYINGADNNNIYFVVNSPTHTVLVYDSNIVDTGNYHHIIVSIDTTNATSESRIKMYIDGVLQTPISGSYPSQNAVSIWNDSTMAHYIGRLSSSSANSVNGYLAEYYFIDGSALTAEDFGEWTETGVWVPKAYTGSYGTNGFYLDFRNSGSLGADYSGNNNSWTVNNLNTHDQMIDSPTNNFSTLADVHNDLQGGVLSDGNLRYVDPSSVAGTASSSMTFSSGKWYCEFYNQNVGSVANICIALQNDGATNTHYMRADGGLWAGFTGTGVTYTTDDIMAMAIDFDTETVGVYKNGTLATTLTFYPDGSPMRTFVADGTPGATNYNVVANFGQDSSFAGAKTAQGNTDADGNGDFYYPVPAGYKALVTEYDYDAPTLNQSMRFNDDDQAYLSYTSRSTGSTSTWTWSSWMKPSSLGGAGILRGQESGVSNEGIVQTPSGTYQVALYDSLTLYVLETVDTFTNTDEWHHLVVVVDITNATSDNRISVYVDGVRQTLTGTMPANTAVFKEINVSGQTIRIGQDDAGTGFYDGYMAEIYFIDGQALTPEYFGFWNGNTWAPKAYTGTYGANGFYLPFNHDDEVEGFSAVTWRGNGATQYIGGVGFEPDLVWVKNRSAIADHALIDMVRGPKNVLRSSSTIAELTGQVNYVPEINPDGFMVGTSQSVNQSAQSYVAWCWDAGANNTPTGHSSVTYTGNGGEINVTGLGFKPDLLWVKNRTTAKHNGLWDSVRLADGGARLVSNDTFTDGGGETGNSYGVKLNEDGFTINNFNSTYSIADDKYVAWAWDAGDGDPVANYNGSITSTVKANPAKGFSIVTYTGNLSAAGTATVGHGLSQAPELVISKSRNVTGDDSGSWSVRSSYLASTAHNMLLDGTNAASDTSVWGTPPANTSTTFGTNYVTGNNVTGNTYVAYAFHSVAGYSKIGTYTGTGNTANSITSLGFRPGFVMIKPATAVGGWFIYDGSRTDFNSTSRDLLIANLSNAEDTQTNDGYKLHIDADGFTVNPFSTTEVPQDSNMDGVEYIYMAFAGSYSDYVSDYNTDGSIDSRVKANPSKGFSIVNFDGPTASAVDVGHGLSQSLDFILLKDRDASTNWLAYHSAVGTGSHLLLNSTAAATTSTFWSGTSDASTFYLSDGGMIDGNNYIAYCFHSVSGYSDFGSYTGNGSDTGPTVTTGFRPAFVMLKRTNSTNSWHMFDSTRSPTNEVDNLVTANTSNTEVEGATWAVDFNSDGFQIKIGANTGMNASGDTYIYMAFADNREAAFWRDESGNNNHWESYALTESDISEDRVTKNFPTLDSSNLPTGFTLSEGNLKSTTTASGVGQVFATQAMQLDEKYYWELTEALYGQEMMFTTTESTYGYGLVAQGSGLVDHYNDSSNTTISSWTISSNDVFGLAVDNLNKTYSIYQNGNLILGNQSFAGDALYPFIAEGTLTNGTESIVNFGQDSSFASNKAPKGYTDADGVGDFYYPVPDGYKALTQTGTLSEAVVYESTQPAKYFNTVLWTGDGNAISRSIIGVGFQPDFLWLKERSEVRAHYLQDSVRTIGYSLSSNTTGAENDLTSIYDSFDSDGFTFSSTDDSVNKLNQLYVAWNWKADNTSGSVNNDGSIQSVVAVNNRTGFSIVSYTGNNTAGTTIGHGLSSTPEVIITKGRTSITNWPIYHQALGETASIRLNSTSASLGSVWNNTAPTSTVFTIDGTNDINSSGNAYIAYCFHSVEGFSKFGSYTGNGDADGPFIYCGFRPAWILIKRSDSSASNWGIYDAKRNEYNEVDALIGAETSEAEFTNLTTNNLDMVSNGFKQKATTNYNISGATYIYMAFAEMPFKYANAR